MTNQLHLSFEFFAAKTDEGKKRVRTTCEKLAKFSPEFYSVTYGAGGSTRDTTKDLVTSIQQEGFEAAPHLSFGGDSRDEVLALIQSYKDAGINKLVALRGDLPSGIGGTKQLFMPMNWWHWFANIAVIILKSMLAPTQKFIPKQKAIARIFTGWVRSLKPAPTEPLLSTFIMRMPIFGLSMSALRPVLISR